MNNFKFRILSMLWVWGFVNEDKSWDFYVSPSGDENETKVLEPIGKISFTQPERFYPSDEHVKLFGIDLAQKYIGEMFFEGRREQAASMDTGMEIEFTKVEARNESSINE